MIAEHGDQRPRRGRPADPYVDEALRTAALDVISRSGWRGATVERIAERAGVARTTIYRRHGSVHGVMLLVLDHVYSRAPVPDTGLLRDDLIELVRRTAAFWRNPQFKDFVCAMGAAQREDPSCTTAYLAQMAARRTNTMTIVERAVERGELPSDVDGRLLLDLLFGLFSQRFILSCDGVDDDDVPAIVDTVVAGFTAVGAR
ncbi:TetR/AcrR family transcriptional regulator [Jatrophihabitans endophyticus]|uniref:TetR/AcrR family transcriptional regulator n=1 Tax=Jatrophihabitans endophyticus TaxID=1206085 RepID=UPI0019FFE62C|nr:TetR/AcrR family transcriptional regulator [Jatrophihabitans endophyticus]MBE7189547.1 TetR/AcrR family transcriptional regulator [Jatrophihabitans endophyticus]